MSRIGRQPVPIPAGVKVNITGTKIRVEGPKGKLEFDHHPNMKVVSDGKTVTVSRPNDERQNRALHGLTRALVNNMVLGVSKGYEKRLKIVGVGFQPAMKGKGVELTVGYANRLYHEPPEGVTVQVLPEPPPPGSVANMAPFTIVVSGADKQKVGQFAANIRASRKPEPYKGKGVRYEHEKVRTKEGKSFAAGK